MLKITQVRSGIRRKQDHKDTLRALGLRRPHQSVYHDDTPTVRGMLRKIGYLLEVSEVDSVETDSAESETAAAPARKPAANTGSEDTEDVEDEE